MTQEKKRLVKELFITDEVMPIRDETLQECIQRLEALKKQYEGMFEVLTVCVKEHYNDSDYSCETIYSYTLQGDRYETDEEVARRLEVARKRDEAKRINAEKKAAALVAKELKTKEERRKQFLSLKKEFEE